jgi:hypothetical protein
MNESPATYPTHQSPSEPLSYLAVAPKRPGPKSKFSPTSDCDGLQLPDQVHGTRIGEMEKRGFFSSFHVPKVESTGRVDLHPFNIPPTTAQVTQVTPQSRSARESRQAPLLPRYKIFSRRQQFFFCREVWKLGDDQRIIRFAMAWVGVGSKIPSRSANGRVWLLQTKVFEERMAGGVELVKGPRRKSMGASWWRIERRRPRRMGLSTSVQFRATAGAEVEGGNKRTDMKNGVGEVSTIAAYRVLAGCWAVGAEKAGDSMPGAVVGGGGQFGMMVSVTEG